jgi:dTDP-4-amino-4,6-dideoxygalactose transaminase
VITIHGTRGLIPSVVEVPRNSTHPQHQEVDRRNGHGSRKIEGINSRLDGMQAAILSAKLPHLPGWTLARQHAAKVYDAGLNQIADVVVPGVAADRTHVYHLYTIQHPRRDALAEHLKVKGVQTAINYPTSLPFLAAYSRFGHRPEQFPNAHRQQSMILSLPMFAEITRDQQRAVIDLIREF